MSMQHAVVAGRSGGSTPARPVSAITGPRGVVRDAAIIEANMGTNMGIGGVVRDAALGIGGAVRGAVLGIALWAGLAGAASAQPSWRERAAGRVTRESAGTLDSALLAVTADSLAAAARDAVGAHATVPMVARFRSRADSVAYETTRARAERDNGLRVIVSLLDRELYVVDRSADTLLVANVAIGVDTVVTYGAKAWRFETPRGRRTVLRKQENPVWVPPEWHYVEVAAKRGLKLAYLRTGKPVPLADGTSLTVRDGRVGRVGPDGVFAALPADEEIVFDGKVFVPPFGTANRRIPGELGRFKMELGDGYMLHGTPHEDTIGQAATHGCVRLFDEDIEWLYQNVPAGTPVYIY